VSVAKTHVGWPESEGEGCRSPEGSDFAAEVCEESGPNTEEGHK
jgi:hypothetical protein